MTTIQPNPANIMPLNPAQQALIAARAYADRYDLPITDALRCADVEAFGESYFGMYRLNWQGGYETLAHQGQLSLTGDTFTLTPAGASLAKTLRARYPKHVFAYNEFFYRARHSPAHSLFCERVYGRDLCQHGMMDMAQLDALVALLQDRNAGQVLEMGCGNGAVAAYIAEHCNARVTGVDLADEGIHWAQEIAATQPEKLHFICADMYTIDFPPESFDAIVLVDAIYFVPDMAAFTRRLCSFLRPGGKLYVFFSDSVEVAAQSAQLAVDATPFAKTLHTLRLRYSSLDFSASEASHWRIKRAVAEEMQPAFEAEGNAWLHHRRWIETHCHQPYLERGGVSRYLYVVEK